MAAKVKRARPRKRKPAPMVRYSLDGQNTITGPHVGAPSTITIQVPEEVRDLFDAGINFLHALARARRGRL